MMLGTLNTTDPRVGHDIKARLMENIWHMLFGQEADNCAPADQFYCRNFGLCELKCPSAGRCKGHYWRPPRGVELPAGWPKEGQGEGGWPIELWWLLDV